MLLAIINICEDLKIPFKETWGISQGTECWKTNLAPHSFFSNTIILNLIKSFQYI